MSSLCFLALSEESTFVAMFVMLYENNFETEEPQSNVSVS
jgi:hypothetical protein